MKVVVAGGTGALGRRLCDALEAAGHDVVVLTRSPGLPGGHRRVAWDGRTVGAWAEELEGAAVVNLAGELVDRRPTRAAVELLTRSRVDPTRALAVAAQRLAAPPPVWLQMSTLAVHGDAGDAVLTEASPPADGPPQMAGVARAWEEAARGVRAGRCVVLRTGVVLDRDAPALERLLLLARTGAGGRVASGRQWVSWLHVEDFTRLALHALEPGSALDGVVVASGPAPVRNAELMAELRRLVRRPPSPPTPAPFVRLGAVLLRTDPALALTGRRALPVRLLADGFRFVHPDLRGALEDLVP